MVTAPACQNWSTSVCTMERSIRRNGRTWIFIGAGTAARDRWPLEVVISAIFEVRSRALHCLVRIVIWYLVAVNQRCRSVVHRQRWKQTPPASQIMILRHDWSVARPLSSFSKNDALTWITAPALTANRLVFANIGALDGRIIDHLANVSWWIYFSAAAQMNRHNLADCLQQIQRWRLSYIMIDALASSIVLPRVDFRAAGMGW